MAWWLLALKIVGYIAAFFIVRALTPKPETPQPKGIGDFDLPTADSDRCIPVIFGSVKIPGGNVIWYGDLDARIFQIDDQDAGYDYRLGVAMALCMGPVDGVTALFIDEKNTGWTYMSTEADGHVVQGVSAFNLFGGHKVGGNGGVAGTVHVYYGTDVQNPDPYMAIKCSSSWPAMRGVCWLMFRNIINPASPGGWPTGFWWGISEYIRPVAVFAHRCPNTLPGLTAGHHRWVKDGGYDANPACMLYEILTDSTWGLGVDAADIDAASFVAAGEALWAETLGLAMVIDRQMSATDAVAEILRNIDADLTGDVRTGKLTLTLVRDDYDPADLPLLDESCVTDVELTRGSWSETTNIVKVNYTSRLDGYTAKVAQWQNSANRRIRGVDAAETLDFRGLTNATAALRVAGRCIKAVSFPFARLKVTANRKAWALRRGQPFRLTWPPLGIVEMVCRVTRPNGGELAKGGITIEAVEDSFDVAGTGFTDPPASGWVDPVGAAVAAAQQALIECPFHLAPDGLRWALALVARADGTLLGFESWQDPAGGTNFAQGASIPAFCGTGTLVAAYAKNTAALDTTGFQIENLYDPDAVASTTTDGLYAGVNLALIDSELVAWQTIAGTGGTRTLSYVLRGVLDTVPVDHALGARVWILRPGSPPLTGLSPFSSEVASLRVKVLPYNTRNVLPIADATVMTLAVGSRYAKPYPPGRVRVGGVAWPTTLAAGADVVVGWALRHRTAQKAAAVMVSQDATEFAAAAEGGFRIEVRVAGVLRRTDNGPTSSTVTWTWTAAMQTADSASAGSAVTIRIIPKDAGGTVLGTYQERGFTLS